MKEIVYISIGNVSVLESQVLELIKYYIGLKGNYYSIILLCGYSNLKEKEQIEKKLDKYRMIKVRWFRYYPFYPILSYLSYLSLKNEIVNYSSDTIYHVRGVLVSYILKKVLKNCNYKLNIVCDCRGLALEESLYKQKKRIGSVPRRILRKINIFWLSRVYSNYFSDACGLISVVSPRMKEYLVENFDTNPNIIFYNPNIANNSFTFSLDERMKLRKEYGIDDNDIVCICSSNGSAVWQKDLDIANILIKRGVKVFNLSRSPSSIPNIHNVSVNFEDMPKFLSMADMAILWRDNEIMNNVASPSKFSEFAVMGLFVIHNNTVYVASEFIKKSNYGLIVDDINVLVSKGFVIDNTKRLKTMQIGKEQFSLDIIGNNYIRMYNMFD